MKLNKGFYLFAVLGLMLVLGTAPLEAGKEKETVCDDGKDNDGDGKTDCADPNCRKADYCTGGEEPSDPHTTAVLWAGSYVFENEPRLCIHSPGFKGIGGVYSCESVEEQIIYFTQDFSMIPHLQLLRSGDEAFCRALDGAAIPANKGYAYVYNCDVTPCTIRLHNGFYPIDPPIKILVNEIEYQIGGLKLEATIDDFSYDVPGGNPFEEYQEIDFSEITVMFYRYGSDKKLAKCQYLPTESQATFKSAPISTPTGD